MTMKSMFRTAFLAAGALALFVAAGNAANLAGGRGDHKTSRFEGAKANTGYAMHSKHGDTHVLTLSDDFEVPNTPAPHWQVVDSEGNTYLLKRLKIKDDKYNKSIELPAYIHDVEKVQIWCAWAETLLGEASFENPVK
jgi:hypothetical protein